MKTYRIAAIPGDGIGKDVIPVGLDVLNAAAEAAASFALKVERFPWGCEYSLTSGFVMPTDGLDTLRQFDAIYFGATGHPGVEEYLSPWRFILVVRNGFEQYVNMHPVKLLEGVSCPLVGKGPADIDLVILRENTESEFAGPGGRVHPGGHPHELAMQVTVHTRYVVERLAHFGFQLARRRRRKVTNVGKSNALLHSGRFWDEVVAEVAAQYPDVEYEQLYVDACAMNMIKRPERFDVIITTNLFGDILSDLAAGISGGIGMGPRGNINPERKYPSMFEPISGSVPKYAGTGRANPIGAIWAGALMLDHLGETRAAQAIIQAIADVVREGRTRPPELGGTATTTQVGQAIAERVTALLH